MKVHTYARYWWKYFDRPIIAQAYQNSLVSVNNYQVCLLGTLTFTKQSKMLALPKRPQNMKKNVSCSNFRNLLEITKQDKYECKRHKYYVSVVKGFLHFPVVPCNILAWILSAIRFLLWFHINVCRLQRSINLWKLLSFEKC